MRRTSISSEYNGFYRVMYTKPTKEDADGVETKEVYGVSAIRALLKDSVSLKLCMTEICS